MMGDETVKHTRACLAKSMIAAIENFRDADWTDHEAFAALSRDVMTTAEGYLADGLMTCQCPQLTDRDGHVITEWSSFAGEITLDTGEIFFSDTSWQDDYVRPMSSVDKPGAPVWQCCRKSPTHIAEFDDGSAIYSCKSCATSSPVRVHLSNKTTI